MAVLAAACSNEARNKALVEVLRVAPAQLLADSLEITPRLDTTHDAPERGQTALTIEIGVRNTAVATKRLPRIAFRAVPEGAPDSAMVWEFVIGRRTVDSLRAGESANFGVSTSPGALATGTRLDGVYRVEAVFGDSTSRRPALPLGRIRLRVLADTTADDPSP
jgi:hypothetical protein